MTDQTSLGMRISNGWQALAEHLNNLSEIEFAQEALEHSRNDSTIDTDTKMEKGDSEH